jgi:hypothetical protein
MSQASTSEASKAIFPATSFFSLGAELLGEVQKIVGHSKVKALRLNLGGRHIKDIPVNPATAIATVLLVIAAVVISNLRVEVVKEPMDGAASATSASGGS